MVKASALYIVIVIALAIGVICSSAIAAAYYYKQDYQQKERYNNLSNNLASGINILLADAGSKEQTMSLFGTYSDSVILKRKPWGIYDVGVVEAFAQKDTLYKTFTIGFNLDSAKWAAIYLTDEDRPLSLSGRTNITGNAFLPKAGVQSAYIRNTAYQGDKRLIVGTKRISEKNIPALDEERLSQLEQMRTSAPEPDFGSLNSDSTKISFLGQTHLIELKRQVTLLANKDIEGNLVLLSDTTVIIDGSTSLKNILIFAKAIIVKRGFKGNCQLFATDSVKVESNCYFAYPSCIGILHGNHSIGHVNILKITVGENSTINGSIFSAVQPDAKLKPYILVGKM